ncbi:MAG: glycosyltransferase family 4 protein [Bacteroidetes bacterium]|nr:glycosyltransferase family 4 protein [Bacteroidota bacterium]
MATFNERLARAFQQQNYKVTIYTFSLQYPSFLFPGSTQYSTEPAPTDLNIKVLINSINPINWIKTGLALKKARPDIIVVRYWMPFMGPCFGSILRIAKKNKHSKIVCIADNVIPHEKHFYDRVFTKYFIPPIDAFITMSQKVLQDLKEFTSTKPAIQVLHPLYDNFGEKISQAVARKNLGIAADEKIILFFGFIRKYKGLDILLDAMPLILKKIPELKLMIAGEYYEDEKIYEQQIKKYGLQNSLIMKTGFVADQQIKNYLCAANVVIQPYRHATQSGVTPLAYHFEIPMIVTNVGALPDMVPDGKVGLVAEPNAISIAEKVIEYFEKGEAFFLPALIDEKKKYSWDTLINQIVHLAQEVIG